MRVTTGGTKHYMKPLEENLGYKFRNSLLLAEALTHPSLAYETLRPHFDNQRLEFLGDAVLQLALTDHLYRLFPGHSEGDMTKLRARMVSKDALFKFANQIDLGDYVMLGKGEESSGGRERASTLADAFEAVLGAIYLDSGFESACDVVLRIVEDEVKAVSQSPVEKNPKGLLQEVLQAIVPVSPEYEIIHEEGPDHCKKFYVRITWNGDALAEGEGSSKKLAEANAAQIALQERPWEK